MDSVKTEADKPSTALPVQKKPKFDQLRADHEMFLKAFESESQVTTSNLLSKPENFSSFGPRYHIFYSLFFLGYRTNTDISFPEDEKCCSSEFI